MRYIQYRTPHLSRHRFENVNKIYFSFRNKFSLPINAHLLMPLLRIWCFIRTISQIGRIYLYTKNIACKTQLHMVWSLRLSRHCFCFIQRSKLDLQPFCKSGCPSSTKERRLTKLLEINLKLPIELAFMRFSIFLLVIRRLDNVDILSADTVCRFYGQ